MVSCGTNVGGVDVEVDVTNLPIIKSATPNAVALDEI